MKIRIPRTAASRGGGEWAKVLTGVNRHAPSGFGFEGVFVRPGSTVDDEIVFLPGCNPRFVVLLECAGPDRAAGLVIGEGNRRFRRLFVLWRYDREAAAWRELARASALNCTWTDDLRPIALRALQGDTPPAKPATDAVVARIAWLLKSELESLDGDELAIVLDALHDELAARIVSARP